MKFNELTKMLEFSTAREMTRRHMLQRTVGLAAGALAASRVADAIAAEPPKHVPKAAIKGKTVYLSFMFHGNMCYDRYTKQEIREKFPPIYATGVRALHKHPEVTAHIDFPGLTLLSLKRYAPWFLEELKPLVDRRQVIMAGSQYAASHAFCSNEESDLMATRVTMELMRREYGPDVTSFFPQEAVYHPQMPYILEQAGATRLLTWNWKWQRPYRIRGIDGSSTIMYPIHWSKVILGRLEEYYDTHEDGSFVMSGGDFEQLGDLGAYKEEIARLAAKGKVIKWTTVERYEQEVGIIDHPAQPPFGHGEEDREESPSMSHWTSHPEDPTWHKHAVQAMDAVRSATFANVCASLHKLGPVDVPLAHAWTTGPDNPWDACFEEVTEFPETEASCLAPGGKPTLLSRAWHHLLIGLNSDSSGWFPWTPRTRHRQMVLDSSRALSNEVAARCAQELAKRLRKPRWAARGWILALNAGPARTTNISIEVDRALSLADADGSRLPGCVTMCDGKWLAEARVDLPAYGYRLLALKSADDVCTNAWTSGSRVELAGRSASLNDGRLTISEGSTILDLKVPPFKLTDPSGVAPTVVAKPDWSKAFTRVRKTTFGSDIEILTELAWTVWLRVIIGLRQDHCLVTAEVHVDMPRRINRPEAGLKPDWEPAGLLLEFHGKPGRGFYDIPYATIEHKNPESSFVAVQRFAALDSGATSFAVVPLGGDQSFKFAAREGIIGASLSASIIGRPDTRPECVIRQDGYADHNITSGGDHFLGTYEHRYALVFGQPADAALRARALRTEAPLVHVEPGGGSWPTQRTLIEVEPGTAAVTAFRKDQNGLSIVLNDLSGTATRGRCAGQTVDLEPFGVATVKV